MLGERFAPVLAAAAAGDREAFGELWRSSHPVLMRYLRATFGQAADDLASDTWVKAIGALGSFSGDEAGFRGWLVVIARNHARDLGRRAVRRGETPTADPDVLAGTHPAQAPDTADLAVERDATTAALRLVASLPTDQAEMVLLRVVVGLDVADVASVVGKSPGAVRVAVHRALRTLATRWPHERPVTPGTEEALSPRDV